MHWLEDIDLNTIDDLELDEYLAEYERDVLDSLDLEVEIDERTPSGVSWKYALYDRKPSSVDWRYVFYDANDCNNVYARIWASEYNEEERKMCERAGSSDEYKRLYKQFIYRLFRDYGVR